MKTQVSKGKLVTLLISLVLALGVFAAFIIIGAANFSLVVKGHYEGIKDMWSLLYHICKVCISYITFQPGSGGELTKDPAFYIIFIGMILFAIFAIVLWVLGIVRKRAHYIFSGLYMVALYWTLMTFTVYLLAIAKQDENVLGVILSIAALCGVVVGAVFFFLDAFINTKVVDEPIKEFVPTLKDEEVADEVALVAPVKEEPVKEEKKPEPVKEEPAPLVEPEPEEVKKEEKKPVAKKKAPVKKPAAKKEEAKPEPKKEEPKKDVKKASSKKVEPKKEEKKPAPKKEEVKAEPEEKEGTGKVYHVSFRDDKNMWQVKAEKSDKANKMFKTQKEAIEYARSLDSSVKVHSQVGKIRKA